MLDRLELIIDNRTVRGFKSYTLDSDLYNAADAFDLELGNPDEQIRNGSLCTVRVNESNALIGIIEKVNRSGNKQERRLSVGGRDLMGLVVDWYVEKFDTLTGQTLEQLARHYIAKVNYARMCELVFGKGVAALSIPEEFVNPSPGQRIFDLLHDVSVARGVLIYMLPEGTHGKIVFDKPGDRGESRYALVNGPQGCNVLDYDWSDDISARYGLVTVYGNKQSTDDAGVDELSLKATVHDDTFALRYKPFVTQTGNGAQSLRSQAEMIMKQQFIEGRKIKYVVSGHSQKGLNWETDRMVEVNDARLGIKENMLIYRRTFKLSKEAGATTEIYVGKAGVVV